MRTLLILLAVVLVAVLVAACSRSAKKGAREEPGEHDAHRHGGPGHGPGHGHHDHMDQARFQDAEAWVARFESPERDGWQKPDEVVSALNLPPGAKVADVGAGTGYFAVRLARAVPDGVVYASDLEPDMVAYLRDRAVREGLPNLKSVQATPDDAKLPEAVDLVLMVNTHHHISERPAYFRRLGEKLAPRGRIAIIDFKPESALGPPEDHKLPAQAVERDLVEAGFVLVERVELLPEQYFLIFAR